MIFQTPTAQGYILGAQLEIPETENPLLTDPKEIDNSDITWGNYNSSGDCDGQYYCVAF